MFPRLPPILSCPEAAEFERAFFADDAAREWTAMQQAGRAVAEGILTDYAELGPWPQHARLLVLVGKGHNGGDALIAAQAILEKHPHAQAEIVFVFGPRALRPLAARAWRELQEAMGERVRVIRAAEIGSTVGRGLRSAPLDIAASNRPGAESRPYHVAIDGVFGFQYRPPLDAAVAAIFSKVNALDIALRAAVDLPSGLDAPEAFRADFTYATGSVKTPVLTLPNAGRVRFIDLGFFAESEGRDERPARPDSSARTSEATRHHLCVITSSVLAPWKKLRPAQSDKRTYGHVFICGGSRRYPGAVLMSVRAALKSGAGLVTAMIPESLVPAFAAQVPEAIWLGWPETPDGGLALEGLHLWRENAARATALVLGPGLGREPETLALAEELARSATVPLVLDADALQPAIVHAARGPKILTPHTGELARIAGEAELLRFAAETKAVVVAKGPITRVCDGAKIFHNFTGGPVLARGGSGDVLAGLIGGLLAQHPRELALAACAGVYWHGAAADELARARGQVAVTTTELLEYLPTALRR